MVNIKGFDSKLKWVEKTNVNNEFWRKWYFTIQKLINHVDRLPTNST